MFKKYFSTLKFYSKRLLSLQKLPNQSEWAKQEKILMEPFDYIQKLPCKHHAMLSPAFNHWLQIPKEKLSSIQEFNQMWISWNILLDDIQDDSAFRYGMPAAHKVYGVGLTINAATKTLLLIQQQLAQLGHPLAPQLFFERMEDHLRGQGIDIYWRENYICPTEEAFIEMAKNKIGTYFAFPIKLMQLFSNDKKDYTGLATNIGIYYEIVDDYYNLFQSNALQNLAAVKQVSKNHQPSSDITECKITLPIVHASQFPDVASELADILKQRTNDPKLHNRVISLLKKHGSDEYIRDILRKLEADIRTEINELGGNAKLTAFMDDLCFQNQETKQ